MALAGILILLLKPWLDHIEFQSYVVNRPLVDAALFLIFVSVATFLL